jgi:phosphohistidine phosphatase SixA
MPSIYFLRHSKAAPNADDRKRELTSEGIALAQARRESLGNPKFGLVIHSDRLRTEQTARIVAGLAQDEPTITLSHLMTSNGKAPWDARIDAAYMALGNAPLKEFLEVAGREMGAFCRVAVEALMYVVHQSDDENILIVGHGILTQAICHHLTFGANDNFLTDVVDECQGYELEFNPVLEDASLVRNIK